MGIRINLIEPSLFNQPITSLRVVFLKLFAGSQEYSQDGRPWKSHQRNIHARK